MLHKHNPKSTILKIEVTGTERMRGSGYWVRPDKIEYAENHPDEDVWIILHYSEPTEILKFIHPIKGKAYVKKEIKIKMQMRPSASFKKVIPS